MELQVKTEDAEGNIVFEGTLSPKEHDFVITVGINYLLSKGASPFFEKREDVTEVDGTDTVQ